jgi:hypothetical protein
MLIGVSGTIAVGVVIVAAFAVQIVGAIAAGVTAGTGITSGRRSGLALSTF